MTTIRSQTLTITVPGAATDPSASSTAPTGTTTPADATVSASTRPARPWVVAREHDDCTVLMVLGEIDVATADRFAEDLARAVTQAQGRHHRVVLDLTGVGFLGAVGIRILERHHHALTAVLVTRHGPARAALARSRLRTRLVYRPRHHIPTDTVPRPRSHD